MRVNERMKKILSIALTLCMILSYIPAPAYAVGTDCTHHTEHTAECGYVEAVAGVPCAHVHDENCGYVEAVAEVLCACEATDENGAIVHTEGCGYVAPVTGADCTHSHDAVCGYEEAAEGSACTYVCQESHGEEPDQEPSEEPEEELYPGCAHHNHDDACGGITNACGFVCGTCVAEIQAMVDALPDMEDITDESKPSVAQALSAIDARKYLLSYAGMAAIDFNRYADAAFAMDIPENFFGFCLEKRYEASAASMPQASFAFLDDKGEAATVITAEGASVTSVSPVPNGEAVRCYLPVGTYTLEESVAGQWDMTLSVNDRTDSDHSFTGESGRTYSLTAVNTWRGYDITIDSENGNVTVTVNGVETNQAMDGDIVTLTLIPDEGYILKELTFSWEGEDDVEIPSGENGTYTFTMPWGDVTVTAIFEPHEHEFDPTTGECFCGEVCTHADVDLSTGKCICSAQMAAKIGTTFYATLAQAAEKAAKNDTIVVLTDVTIAEGETLHFPVFVRLDANGNTITCNGDVTIGSEAGILFENELYYYGGDVNGTELCPDREPTYYKAGQGNVINTYDEETDTYIMVMADATLNNESGDGISLPASHLGANLHLEFRGQNTVTAANVGIWVSCAGSVYDLILSGEDGAILSITMADTTGDSKGIYAKSITITGGTVNVVSGNALGDYSCGIDAGSIVVEEGATLNMTIGKALSAIGTYGSISGGGTVNGLIAVPADNALGIAFAASGKTVLTADFTASIEGMLLPFAVPADTSLTVNEGVTLDLSGLTLNDIDFSGEIINHGTILLPAGFVMDNAPEDGTITVGDKSYTWDEENDKWICNNENSHTGGTATCNRGKICDLCGTEYGEKDANNHTGTLGTPVPTEDDTQHIATWSCCEATVTEEHSFDETGKCVCGTYIITIGNVTAKNFDGTDRVWQSGDTIRVDVWDKDNGGYERTELTYDGTSWGSIITDTQNPVVFAVIGNGMNLDVNANKNSYFISVSDQQEQSPNVDDYDLMYAYKASINTDAQLDLHFEHLFTKITVNIEYGSEFTETPKVEYVLFISEPLKPVVTITGINDGNLHFEYAEDWIHPSQFINYGDEADMTDDTVEVIVGIGTLPAGYDFIHFYDRFGSTEPWKKVLVPEGGLTFVAGEAYEYNVLITSDGAKLLCAGEHSFTYTPNEDGTSHKKVCSDCGYAVTEEHTLLTYSASGNVITGSCSKCPAVGTATITAGNTTYKGTAQETATVAYSEGWNSGELTVSYVNNVNAGTATASITVGEATASVEFTIAKAEIDGSTLINPEFAEGLIYNGTAQALVTKTGSVDGGYIVYSLSIDGEYTTTIPVATEAGNYRVYWTIECDENHYVDGTPGSSRVTIAKANPEYTVPTGLTATYGDTLANVELPTGWAWKDAETTFVGNAGTRTFKALYNPDSNNYNTVEADVTVEVVKADPEYTVPTGLTATYGDTLADVELPTGWAWNDAESTSVGNAGTRTFKALYNPDSNNYNTVEADITVEVAKALIDIYTDNLINPEFAEGLIYNGTAQALVTNSGSIDGGYIVFSLNPDGEYTTEIPVATEAGEYVVFYRIEGDENHYWEGSSAFEAVTIAAKNASNATVTLDDTSVPFDGTEKTPGVTSVIVDGKTLNAETDYEVSYSNNIYVGTATVTITFKGNYTGNAIATFTIVRAAAPAIQWPTAGSLTYGQKLSESTLTSEDANGTFAWENGEQIPTVTNSGYVVVYTPKDADNYDYSNVTLTKTIPVTVSKAPASVETAPAANTLIYTGEAQALVTAGAAKGGEMQYSTDNQTWSTAIPKGTNAGEYTVYYKVVGDANHIDTDVQSVVVKIGQLAVAEPTVSGTYTYTGKEQMVTLTGVESCMTVASGDKATNAGSYEVVITLDGNHKWADGSDGKVQWSIGKAQAEIAVNTDPITAVYGGTVKLPEATANFGTVTCDTTADKLVNAGTYTVTYTVAGTDNYDGDTKTVTVKINPKAITEDDVQLNGSLVYTGSEQTQQITVTEGIDYVVTGNKATNVGSYTLTVTASGNYTGSVTKDWSIGKAVATVETAPTAKELTYTGENLALVTAGTAKGGKLVYGLTENGTYAETVPTAKNAGSYTVWYYVQGDDNHTDSAKASVKVTIAKAKAEISVNTTPITVTYGEAVMLPTATSSFGTVSRDKTAAELVNAGTYTVTYTVEGTANYEGDTKTLTVIVEKKAVAEPAVTGTYTYTGEEQTAQLTGVESCMTIASGDKATNAGSYEVVITLDGNHKWADGSDGKVQWSIGKAEFGDVYVSQSGMLTYNGTAQTPNVNTDADSVGDQTATFAYRLTENESYGEMPAFTDAGTYTVYYKASAPNHKDATGSFTVTVDKAKAEIAVNTDPITVVYGEAVVLPTATTNFGTVACDKTASDLVNAGTYTVTYSVVGSDNYNGDTKTITVTVNAKVVNQPVIEGIEAVYILSENAITPVPTAVKDGATVIDPSEYTLAYENNTAAGKATVKIVDKEGGNYTVNGSMTFQIVEHEHTWTYTTDSNASKIIATCSNADGHCPNTNGGSVSIQDPDELTYDGSTKDAELVYESWQPEEVTITYNNVDRVNVTGKEIVASIGVVGAGIQSVYTIVAAVLPNATLSADSGTYTGQAHTVTVVLDALVKDTDYTVTIPEDMTNVGTKTITVNGKGNYEGTQNLTYTITKRSDVAAPAPGVGYTIDYAKETITIAEGFEVIDSDGKAVVSGSAADYFGKTLSVRYAETQNTEASAYTSFTLAERPEVPNVTIHNETIKGKADGKITGLDTTMEYSTDGGKHWISVETTDAGEKNLTVGTTIAVRMKATQTAPCSESKTGTVAAGAAITVTYAENGQAADGMPAQVSDLSYGNKLTKPADPTAKNTDFAFRGWYKDAACTTAWDFAKDTVTEETVTLYAKWEQVYFSVTAEIKDHNNVEYHGEVDVKLMRGDSTIDSVTGTAGSFQFSRHVEGGMYNLVAIYTDSTGEHTKTELITVDHDETFVLKLPAPGVNSHLTVSGNAQTPDVMVGELDAEAESIKQQTGATKVEIEMTVTGKTENQVSATVVNAVEEATNDATVEYLDITVTKQIDDGAKTEMSETTNLMEIVVPYNTNGKTNLRVFRHHDGQLQEFAQGREADQTFYYASGYIHIFTKYFSNYMISYEVSHTVTFDANGGTVGTNSLTTQANGTLSTLPTPTREHYVFKGWYTAKSGGTKVTTDTVFNGDATIYAQWGGYAITVADAKNGTVTVDRSEAPGATEITITVTPKTGYKLSALTVKDAAGKSYVISTDNNGKYYFTMPDADVTVKVTFSKISTSTADTTNPKTGDGFQLVPFSSVAATSLLALAVLMLNKKKLYQK